MGAEVMERFLRASREMKELEAEFNRVRLDFDFNFDPGCAMDEYRTGDGCERCGEWGLQSDDGWSCITVGYMEERRGEFFGTTRNGVKEGRGEFRFREDGSRYSGQFLDDLQMGWGRQYFSNGNSYEGDLDMVR